MSRSPNTSIELTSAITGIANMLSDAVPAGRIRRIVDPQQERRLRSTPRRRRAAATRTSRSTAAPACRAATAGSVIGITPASICHATKFSGSSLRPRWKYFDRHRSGRPAEPGQHRPQLGCEVAAPVPRLDHQREPGEREGDRDPLAAFHALVQHGPRDEERPERHREHEHGCAARRRRLPARASSR